MGAYKGTVTRPSTGKRVDWQLAPILVPLGQQLDKLGITWYSIGNESHLRKQGGHTPWKPGTDGHTVTAIDVMKSGYADVEQRILKLMKTSDYDTSWIDFINTNGTQYDYDGRRQISSGDYHLHLEVLPSAIRRKAPNLFYDMFGYPAGVKKPTSSKPQTPAPTVTWEDPDMFKFVQLRGKAPVYVVRGGGKIQHISKEQFAALKNANLKALPSGASDKDKAKVTEAYLVEDEAALAGFGTEIIALTDQVQGLD